jgi:uncharacterized membrane protein
MVPYLYLLLIGSTATRPSATAYRFLPMLAIVFYGYYVISAVVLHVLERRTNPLRYPMSHYASTPHGQVARIQAIVKSAGTICLGIYLLLAYSFLQGGSLLLIASAVASLVAVLFPIDETHRPFRTGDYAHLALAALTFFLLVFAMNTITTNLIGEGLLAYPRVARALITVAFDSLIAFAICFFLPPLRRIAGLAERIFLASTVVWVFLIAGLLL